MYIALRIASYVLMAAAVGVVLVLHRKDLAAAIFLGSILCSIAAIFVAKRKASGGHDTAERDGG